MCRSTRLSLVAVTAVLGLAACGGDGNGLASGGAGTGRPGGDEENVLDAELVAFDQGGGSSPVDGIPAAVLGSAVDVQAWAGWFQSSSTDLADTVRRAGSCGLRRR